MANSMDVLIEALVLFAGGIILIAYPETFVKPNSSDEEKGSKRALSRAIGLAMVVGAIAFAGFQLSKPDANGLNSNNSANYE